MTYKNPDYEAAIQKMAKALEYYSHVYPKWEQHGLFCDRAKEALESWRTVHSTQFTINYIPSKDEGCLSYRITKRIVSIEQNLDFEEIQQAIEEELAKV